VKSAAAAARNMAHAAKMVLLLHFFGAVSNLLMVRTRNDSRK